MNFNPPMCKAGKICIAEVEEIVEVGEIPPEQVHVPSIYVKWVVLGKKFEKWIEVSSRKSRFLGTNIFLNYDDCVEPHLNNSPAMIDIWKVRLG